MRRNQAVEAERIGRILRALDETYPDARIALHFRNPFELLVSVVLSAQCTDERVNKVSPGLFQRFQDAKGMSEAPLSEIEGLIRPTGFFRNKARNLREAARVIVEEFGGEVPRTMEGLIRLPGVARKTANIVLFGAYGIVAGVAVDTHVRRVSKRLALTENDDPVKIERDLMECVPPADWGRISYVLIEHGRRVCQARRPRCGQCPVRGLCPYGQEIHKD